MLINSDFKMGFNNLGGVSFKRLIYANMILATVRTV